MPRWRLFARDDEGWLDLHEIIEGDLLDAEAACARAEQRTGRPVNAEPIPDPEVPPCESQSQSSPHRCS